MAHQHKRLDRATTLDLQQMITRYNPYYTVFKTAHERLEGSDHLSLHLKTIDTPRLDQRRYNLLTASEVAVLIPGTGEEVTNGKRDIVVLRRRVGFQCISDLSSAYAPLRFPLLSPLGRQGWHVGFQE